MDERERSVVAALRAHKVEKEEKGSLWCRGRSKIRPPGRRGSVARNADHRTTGSAVRGSSYAIFAL